MRRRAAVLAVWALGLGQSALAAPNASPPPGGEALSFRAPVDFASGAVGPGDAYDIAAGDQLALQLAHATISNSVVVDDLDHDGDPDAVQTNVTAGTISVFMGDGRGGFAPPASHAVGVHPTFVARGHIDGDRHTDLAVANAGSHDITVLRGDGGGGFAPLTVVPVAAPRNLAVGDFDGDKVADLAVATGAPAPGCLRSCGSLPEHGGVAVFLGSAERPGSSFRLAQTLTHTHSATGHPAGAKYVAIGDFDGSGFADLAVGIGTNRNAGDPQAGSPKLTGDDLLVFLNQNRRTGSPFLSEPSQPAIRVGASPDTIAVADWNEDGSLDLAVLHNGSGDVITLFGDRRGRFTVKATNASVGATPRSVAVGDFNADGVADLATASFQASTVSVLVGNADARGRGDGTFQPAVEFWTGNGPTAVAAGHFDADRRLDLVVARVHDNQLSLLVNDSPKPGDGVSITRDIPYGGGDTAFAAHHMLDVYRPAPGTPSLAGSGRPYPVVVFTHGGNFIAGDKSMRSYLLRTLAREGLLVVSTDYRLGHDMRSAQLEDVARALRWARGNAPRFGGDPRNTFLLGESAGAGLWSKLAVAPGHEAEVRDVRGLVMVAGGPEPADGAAIRMPSLALSGARGFELAVVANAAAFARVSAARGVPSRHVVLPARDHLTLASNAAVAGDEARVHLLHFLRAHLTPPPRTRPA